VVRRLLALACILLAGSAPAAAPAPHGDAVLLVDEATGAIAASVPLEGEPLRVSYGAGAFWVVAPRAGTVYRVEPHTRVLRRLGLGEHPFDAVVAGGALWVPDHDRFDLLRVDLATGAVAHSRNLGSPALAVGYGFGAVWVQLAGARLVVLDPSTLRVTASIRNVAYSREGLEPKVAPGQGAVWVSGAVGNELIRVNPAKRRVSWRRPGAGRGVTLTAGSVWSADGERSVVRVRGRRGTRIRVGRVPVDVAGSASAVWAVNAVDRTLVKIDPLRRRVVRRIGLQGAYPTAVAVGGGFVAVTVS
jgi:streptogramin lyase